MDKKELQNLIDRISLTGPEGIKKIKKVLKELNDGSGSSHSGSMGEDEEYTIAQALNDLNERIEGLEVSERTKQKHILEIVAETDDTVDGTLSCLKLDGVIPTLAQIQGLTIDNFVVIREAYGTVHSLAPIHIVNDAEFVQIYAGYHLDSNDGEYMVDINLTFGGGENIGHIYIAI